MKITNCIPAVPVLGASRGSRESISKLTCNDFNPSGSILSNAIEIVLWIPKMISL